MSTPSENETWVVEAGGDVVEKKAEVGLNGLSEHEQLLYWLWWADYMMNNAGDFAGAEDLNRDFQSEIVNCANKLDMRFTAETFLLPRETLREQYFDRFDRVCAELRGA